jgi:hypothetical protein
MSSDRFPYDRTLREIFQRIPLRFIEIFTRLKIEAVLDPTFPRVTERRADFLARLTNGRIILVEIQLLFDPALPLRMVEYCLRVKERYGVYPLPFILWLGEGKPPYGESFTLGPITFQCVVIDIKEIPSEVLLGSEDENDLLLSVLCKRGEGFWEVLSERLRRLPKGKREEAVLKVAYLVTLRKDLLEEGRGMPRPYNERR